MKKTGSVPFPWAIFFAAILLLTLTLATVKGSIPVGQAQAAGAQIFYISPEGSDAAGGDLPAKAWKTFSRALPVLQPGDSLVLLDGLYSASTTGLPEVDCTTSGTATSGSQQAPITVRAANERQAILQSDGAGSAFYLVGCAYWQIIGLTGIGADLPKEAGGLGRGVFHIASSQHIVLKRLLSARPNRYMNAHTFTIQNSANVLVEECEAYEFHRHGFSIFASRFVTVRRSYANSRGVLDLPDGYHSDIPGGDETYALYWTSDSIVENSVAEFETRGFEIHAGPAYDGTPGGQNNKVLGSIHLNGHYGGQVDSRQKYGSIHPARNNLYRDFLVLGASLNGLWLRSSQDTVVENATIMGAGKSGVVLDEKETSDPWCTGGSLPEGCSFTMRNSLVLDNGTYGVYVRANYDWLVEYSNLASNAGGQVYPDEPLGDTSGHVQHSLSIPLAGAEEQGTRTMVYVASGSSMAGQGKDGADIGANILYRYEDGALTSNPLWDPASGAFPCGAQVPGLNADATHSCRGLHERLNVSPATLPQDYGAPGQGTFADVPPSHPYFAAIEALYAAGYTAGCAQNPLRYCPDQQMNRAESAVFVLRGVHGAGTDPADPPSSPFADLGQQDWPLNWANQLYQDGYTAGCGADPLRYCPWQGHTRAEGAVFYLRMLNGVGYEPVAPAGIFSDVAAGAWYARWVEAAYQAGILPACGQNPLRACPEAPLDRGIAAYMLYQAKDLHP